MKCNADRWGGEWGLFGGEQWWQMCGQEGGSAALRFAGTHHKTLEFLFQFQELGGERLHLAGVCFSSRG